MRVRHICLSCFVAFALGAASFGQSAQAIVTVVGHGNEPVTNVQPAQLEVRQQGHNAAITGWQHYTSKDRLDLVLALDDDSIGMASRLADIKSFMTALPPNVALGLVYFHTGTVQIAQTFTFDHARVAGELRAPTGGASPSPYGSLLALLAKWPRHPDRRREVIMVSDGEEHLGGNNNTNLTFERAMTEAVAGGVVVYTIYVKGAPEQSAGDASGNPYYTEGATTPALGGDPMGAMGRNQQGKFAGGRFDTPNGIANLAELSKQTGGQGFAQGTQTPTRFEPFLSDIGAMLRAQYDLQYTPVSGSGMEGLKIEINDLHGARVFSPGSVWLGH